MTRATLSFALVLLSTRPGFAQSSTSSTGIVADRLVPGVGPLTLFGGEGAAVTPVGRLSWMLSLGYVRDPIKLANALTGDLVSRPVAAQTTLDVAAEVGLYRQRIAFSFGVPLVLAATGDRLAGLDTDDRPLWGMAGGDFRLRAKAALLGNPERRGLHVAAALEVTLPGGGQRDFAATSGVTVMPRLIGDLRVGPVLFVAGAGVRFQPERSLARTAFGDELDWNAGALVALFARRGVEGGAIAEFAGQVGASPGTRPAEVRGGFRIGWRSLSLDLGAGAGLDGDVGAPAWRVFAIFRHALGFD
jgi:hypothetical protein